MLLGFKRRFAEYVEDSSKTHTIRGMRKIPPRVGEICHCYVNPRQKTMRLLGRFPCIKVETIHIDESHHIWRLKVLINGVRLSDDEAEALFFCDGFRDKTGEKYEAMVQAAEFWDGRLPFSGYLIHWGAKKAKKMSCSICDGSGSICDICGESEFTCTCIEDGEDDQSFSDCESCRGRGKWEE